MESIKSWADTGNRSYSKILHKKNLARQQRWLLGKVNIIQLYSLKRRRERYRLIYTWKILEGLVPNIGNNKVSSRTSVKIRGCVKSLAFWPAHRLTFGYFSKEASAFMEENCLTLFLNPSEILLTLVSWPSRRNSMSSWSQSQMNLSLLATQQDAELTPTACYTWFRSAISACSCGSCELLIVSWRTPVQRWLLWPKSSISKYK